ncbi:MAG: hypothetical protein OEU92_19795 [Alphaproteobacteria bacterium]|nr:hypothetical protein [Alphaproteobacteria bacterium]
MTDDYRWVLKLIDRCYGAATDDDHWPAFLKDLRQLLDGHGTTLLFTDAKMRPIDRFFSDNVSPESIADYQAHFHSVDIRMQRTVPDALNSIVTDRDLVDEAIVNGHEFYQDFLRPIGHRYIVAGAMDLEDGSYAFCSTHRGLDQEHADSGILEKAALIMPHIRRSLQLRRRFSTINARGQAALELLDGFAQAVYLIDSEGRIIWQNAWADRLLDQQDGLITNDGELRALSVAASAELQQHIKSAISVSKRPHTRAGGMMTVPRPSLKRSYQLLITPLAQSEELNLASRQLNVSPSAAIFVTDLEQKPVPRTEMLRTLYNLTPAEARLATALGSGVSIKNYAEQAKLSIHYVRWLLKQVEAKTDTRRMTDLIRLLARQTGFFSAIAENGKERNK